MRKLTGALLITGLLLAPSTAIAAGAEFQSTPTSLPRMFHYHRARAEHPGVWMSIYCKGGPHSGGIVTTGAWTGWWYGPGGACSTNEVDG